MDTSSLTTHMEGLDVATTYQTKLNRLLELQKNTPDSPYSIIHRLNLARAYRDLGYPELAASDAYKALLLVDEVSEEAEFHDEALEAALTDLETCKEFTWIHQDRCSCDSAGQENEGSDEERAYKCATTCWLKAAYNILVPCLIDCGSLRSAFNYNMRALKAFADMSSFLSYRTTLSERLEEYFKEKGETFEGADVQDYPDKGLVRRELYPWNEYEPDRYAPDVLEYLNNELAQMAPKLEVKVSELPLLSGPSSVNGETRYVKQLGVFAKEDIPPGETILQEKSLLTAVSRMHETYCDACSGKLPKPDDSSSQSTILSCEDCEEVFYCSEECHDLAQANYHPSICGIDIAQKVPASEAADALYTLLLVRAMALAQHQDVHPLELKEVRYIWGDYHTADISDAVPRRGSDAFAGVPRSLAFSFEANVLRPLHILEKMDVNIFEESHRFDTWVFNTLYAKFRGTASARQSPDMRPELGAVHPMWCLANHSCAPNVSWEWEGSMRFWTRSTPVAWGPASSNSGGGAKKAAGGLRKGEEVFSHYCDVSLPVKERREWAVGALGGICVCKRCVWEAGESSSDGGK